MAMDVIGGLLRVKRIRESSREGEMVRARAHLAQAAQALTQARHEQARRDEHRSQRERDLYTDLCSRLVHLRDIEDASWQVDTMREEARQDQKAVDQADQQRRLRRDQATEAEQAWRLAAQATRKFDELAQRQQEEDRRLAEQAADAELDEHAERGRNGRAGGLTLNEDAQDPAGRTLEDTQVQHLLTGEAA